MKKIASILLLSVTLFSCKKTEPAEPDVPPGKAVKKPLGTPVGNEVTAVIGAAGGSLQSADGNMRLTIPAGAVSSETNFSIQQVTNTLGTAGLSYRLKPEGVSFGQPVKLEYYYGSIDLGSLNPKMLFLACQDKDGYYYSARNTKGSVATNTLTVETTHFSDWTFYAKYNLYVDKDRLTNGKVHLKESESFSLVLDKWPAIQGNNELDLLQEIAKDPVIQAAQWDYIEKKGTLTVTQNHGSAVYKAPAQIPAQKEIVVTAMLTGNLGKDNEGNPVQMMQFSQPVILESGDYFILTENGAEMAASSFEADPAPFVQVQVNAVFSNGYNLSLYEYSGVPGGSPYKMHGTPGAAAIDLVDGAQVGWRSFRPERCDTSSQLFFSPGQLVLTKVANSIGEYTEGHFTVTLWKYSYCQSGGSKTLSGKFRIRKKV